MIILSPSKGQDFDAVDPTLPCSQPAFADQARLLITALHQYTPDELRTRMRISPALAARTHAQIRAFGLASEPTARKAKQALLAFSGEAFRSLNAAGFSGEDLLFAQERIRILSGLYGCLRALDLIQPHRLEMNDTLTIATAKNLAAFWSDRITESLRQALAGEQQPILINLASAEYAKVIRRERLHAPWLDIQFKEEKGGSLKTVALFAKRARGLMTGFLVRNRIENPADLQRFTGGGYAFRPHLSNAGQWVFTRPMD
jgi:cytoplasmic iron level regulating protein YaaA (DUF328/UPF0246 family)